MAYKIALLNLFRTFLKPIFAASIRLDYDGIKFVHTDQTEGPNCASRRTNLQIPQGRPRMSQRARPHPGLRLETEGSFFALFAMYFYRMPALAAH